MTQSIHFGAQPNVLDPDTLLPSLSFFASDDQVKVLNILFDLETSELALMFVSLKTRYFFKMTIPRLF